MSCKISGFLNFHVSHLNYDQFKLYLQNTLNTLKMTMVYFEELQSRWAAGQYVCIYIYIYIYIYICTRLAYTTDTVPPGYGLVRHNSMFVRLLLVYQFILNLNLSVNILLRTFKSFLGKYNIVCIFYTNK